MMNKLFEAFLKSLPLVFKGVILFGLFLTSLYSYILFHSLTEIFSIVIGCSIFILAWNSRHRLDNDYLLFLGIAYLFVSGLDLIHTLAYRGIEVFPGYDTNLPTQLWIAARYVQALSMLIFPLFLRRKLNVYLTFLGYGVVTSLLLWAIFAGVFPACFLEGVGLTSFKKVSEYIISLILVASAVALFQKRDAFDPKVMSWLIVSLVLTIGAELAFTFYISVYDFSNLIGHFFKIIAFYLIYKAITEMGLEKPHQLLFRNLKQSETALRNALEEVERLAITDSLTSLYNRRHLFELADRELQRSRRYRLPLSVVMVDIDEFKRVNDTYGHAIGDQVLQGVAESCRKELREVDVIGRYGGDEFVALLPETGLSAACQVAERLRKSIAERTLDTKAGRITVTVSLGIAVLDDEHLTPESLLDRADQALYVAKQNGRNRVWSPFGAYPDL
jgi:diguanylate cyclase (GGDEF)-like protein